MSSFDKWNHEFLRQNLYIFNNNEDAILWLKVRAICRGKQLKEFLFENQIKLSSSKLAEQNRELYELLEKKHINRRKLDSFLKEANNEWYKLQGIDEAKLKDDLYKVKYYVWGGDQNNSLDKYLVSHYVKNIHSYDVLLKRQQEIAENAWDYVQASWYNNWTSYLIESLFKNNKNVVSAIGEIKSVDFFLNDYPIDLKVTYFPNQYMNFKLKDKLGKNELSWLRQKAKSVGISISGEHSEKQQLYILTEQLSVSGYNGILDELHTAQRTIMLEAEKNPYELLCWLYANQGAMRFGAENRLFMILADSSDYSQSWKMKRAFRLIEPAVSSYLAKFKAQNLKHIEFIFNGQPYQSLADAIFIIK